VLLFCRDYSFINGVIGIYFYTNRSFFRHLFSLK